MSSTTPNLEITKTYLYHLLNKRQHPKTLCPSEAARALSRKELDESGVQSWRDLMPGLRQIAFAMRDEGEIDILQKGNVLPAEQRMEETTGPIRLRRVRD